MLGLQLLSLNLSCAVYDTRPLLEVCLSQYCAQSCQFLAPVFLRLAAAHKLCIQYDVHARTCTSMVSWDRKRVLVSQLLLLFNLSGGYVSTSRCASQYCALVAGSGAYFFQFLAAANKMCTQN